MNKRHVTNKLNIAHRRWIYIAFALLLLSGVLWLIFHYFLVSVTPFGNAPHPLQTWWLKLHGLAAMGMLIAFGSLMPGHIRHAWQQKKNRLSGGTMVAVMIILTLTGYALYYFAGEESRPVISAIHWLIGLAVAPLILLHIFFGRRASER